MTTFTVTELENAYMCGWKHEFNSFNRLSLESSSPLKALWLGTLVHKALDLLAATLAVPQDGHTFTSKNNICDVCGNHMYAHLKGIHIYQIFANEQLEKITEKYRQEIGADPTYMELKEVHDTIRLGRAMFQNYLDYYKTPLPDTLEYISTEQSLTVDIPGTEHCACALTETCTCEHRVCRPYKVPVPYTYCECIDFGRECTCVILHKLEGTLDGLVRRKIDNGVFILENKTFTFHPKRADLERNHQFMGYTWAGNQHDLNIQGILYNGLWKREKIPNGKTIHDLFVREYIPYTRYELESWENNTRELTLRIGDPNYVPVRSVPPVGGCNGVNMCGFKDLCDARFKRTNYDFILASRYTKRERTSIFADQEPE